MTFQYRVRDAHGALSDPQTFTITVNSVNDVPVAVAPTEDYTGVEDDASVTGTLPAGTDADGDALTYELVGSPEGLTLQ